MVRRWKVKETGKGPIPPLNLCTINLRAVNAKSKKNKTDFDYYTLTASNPDALRK